MRKKNFEQVIPGAEVLLSDRLGRVSGLKLGLVTNHAGVDRQLNSLVERYVSHPRIDLRALFGPEHGIRGEAQAGESVPYSVDEASGLPVFSLYGQDRDPDPSGLDGIDLSMRSYDILEEGKVPARDMLQDLDVLLFDLQGVGTRVYTYIATMAYCLRVCADLGIRFLVLDRPNPINGLVLEGPLLDYPEYSSFVGLYPIPLRHGMTMGELALLFNARFLEHQAELEVVPMAGWRRGLWYDETGLTWIPPSPNMPSLATAVVYPGQVLWEGTEVSEGRGTSRPFELCGAPWIDGRLWAERLNRLRLPGVRFQAIQFAPGFSKYRGQQCCGVRLHVVQRDLYSPWAASLHMLLTLQQLCPDRLTYHQDYFDRVQGTDQVRKALAEGKPAEEIIARTRPQLEDFIETRQPFLLYSD
jgi:uncharacterized protein YbbC (DUF1343 family)